MRRNPWLSSAVGLGLLLLSAACSSSGSKPPGCTDSAGCATGQYCAAGVCTPKGAAGAPCAAGTGHTANDLCASNICSGGNCCTAACASTDPACAAAACDANGACSYPSTGTQCGPAAGCSGSNLLPPSSCNGAGGCTVAAPTSCAPYKCLGVGCATVCFATMDCATGNYCANGVCVAKEDAGATCTGSTTSAPSEACASDVCFATRCCTAACSLADPTCQASACDTVGSCVYPDAGTACGAPESCTAGMHTPPSGCGGDGGCVPGTPVSCGAYNCDGQGLACYSSCTVGDDSRCTASSYCATTGCSAKLTPGSPCGANDACVSAICSGNCCAAACGLDPTTNCQRPCDFDGGCGPHACPTGYGCNGRATCNTVCLTDADCAPDAGYVCSNPLNGSCCLAVAKGATVYVDGKLGADTNCCDTAATACQTITHAMQMVVAAGATGTTLNVAWNQKPTVQADWAPATAETYPIHLGLGVTLKAPGIFFAPPVPVAPAPGVDVFDILPYTPTDSARVTLEGDPAVDYVYIGFDSTQKNLTGATVAVNCGLGATVPLTLTQVWMNGQTEALNLGGGANVTLGPDPVIIGSGSSTAKPLAKVVSPGSGIVCQGSMMGRATLQDDPKGTGVLQIDGQDANHNSRGALKIVDACDVTLLQSPTFGSPPPCSKTDGLGISVDGNSTLSLGSATVQCFWGQGILAGMLGGMGLKVKLDKSLIQHSGHAGLQAIGGSVSPITNTSFFHNRLGVIQQGAATIDLSGGGNVVSCSISTEPGSFGAASATKTAGVNVWNFSANNASMNAANVLWDQAPPALWSCSDGAQLANQNCTCISGSCSGTGVASPEDADAVYNSPNTAASPIDQSDAGLQSTFPVCN